MSREGEYLVFATEQYRAAKGLSGAEVIELFRRHDVEKFIKDSYEIFHIESEDNMIAAIDEYIAERDKGESARVRQILPKNGRDCLETNRNNMSVERERQ